MAYSKTLATRIRAVLAGRPLIAEKFLFGGVGFLLSGNLLVGVWKNALVARLGATVADAALREPFIRPFDPAGRPLTGWVLIDPDALADDDQLRDWIRRAEVFVATLPPK